MWWIIFIFVILLELILNFMRPNAIEELLNKPITLIILILHHIANGFLLYGWLFDNTIILITHVICCLFIMIYWSLNNGLCHLTVYVNEKCNWDKNHHLMDMLYFSGLKSTTYWKEKKIHYLIVFVLGIISLYKIIHKKGWFLQSPQLRNSNDVND